MSSFKLNLSFRCFSLVCLIGLACSLNAAFAMSPLAPASPGGLTLLQPREISIERQDVAISPHEISISYVFRNNFSLDLIETLAFEVPPHYLGHPNHFQTPDDLKILVNGKPIKANIQKRAISLNGKDITQTLKTLGLSTDPQKTLDQLNKPTQAAFRMQEQLNQQALLDPKNNKPLWFEKIIYHWKQQFKATKQIHVKQSYRPEITSIRSIPKDHNLPHCTQTAEHAHLLATHQQIRSLFLSLTQDSNWSRPIKVFTLKMNTPKSLTPLVCWPHPLESQGFNQHLFYAEDFVPLEDLYVYYLS